MGSTEVCKVCIAIILHKSSVTHDERCRLRVMGKASDDPAVASRVKVARAREDEWQAKKPEESATKQQKPEVAPNPSDSASSVPECGPSPWGRASALPDILAVQPLRLLRLQCATRGKSCKAGSAASWRMTRITA